MGIYDREYYRGETRGSAWFVTGQVTKSLILINVAVFLAEQLDLINPRFIEHWFAASSDQIFRHGHIWQLVTATFLHGDLGHILWNMLFLWMVGRELEGMYGHHDFLALYLTAGAFSTLGWALLDEFSPSHLPMVGASGAVVALAVLYTLFYPRREVLFMFVIPVEMWILASVYVASQVYFMLRGGDMRTAVEAHVAGALYGYLYKQFDLRWSRLPISRRRRPRLRIVTADPATREKPAPRPAATVGPTWSSNSASIMKPTTTAVVTEEQLDARLDEILAKIAREGRGGLSEEENRILLEASRRARNRRSERL